MEKIIKPWGYEKILEKNEHYVLKELFMKKGHSCSRQYHNYKTETIVVQKGRLTIDMDGKVKTLNKGHAPRTITPGTIHRMSAEHEDVWYLEVSTTELDDVVRLEDSYGRV